MFEVHSFTMPNSTTILGEIPQDIFAYAEWEVGMLGNLVYQYIVPSYIFRKSFIYVKRKVS